MPEVTTTHNDRVILARKKLEVLRDELDELKKKVNQGDPNVINDLISVEGMKIVRVPKKKK